MTNQDHDRIKAVGENLKILHDIESKIIFRALGGWATVIFNFLLFGLKWIMIGFLIGIGWKLFT